MAPDSPVRFTRSDGRIRVGDTLNGEMYELGVPSSAGPMTVVDRTEEFPAPLDRTVTVRTDRLDLPETVPCGIHPAGGTGGTPVWLGTTFSTRTGPAGGMLELNPAVKTYLRFPEPFTVHCEDGDLRVDLPRRTKVTIGARAWHRYPEATIQVRERPRDILKAVSRFGSSLLTTSPDRSFPTLRGHPPAMAVGNGLDIPDGVAEPDSEIELVVRPRLADICAVAPLAYYLPATLVAGDRFGIRCAGETFVPPQSDVADAAAAVLRHCFTLDCLVRVAGQYTSRLDEHERFEATGHDVDYAALFDASPAERTARYLEIPFEAVRPCIPLWPTTAVLTPSMQSVPSLPGFAAQLAAIRVEDPPRYSGSAARKRVLQSFVASEESEASRSSSQARGLAGPFVDVPTTDSERTVWVGDGVPLGAVAFRLAGRQKRYDRATAGGTTQQLSATVVCNDASMATDPEALPELVDFRPDLDIDYTLERRTTTARLREVIERETDYLHFIGHATPEGLECVDGQLDVAEVSRSGARLFCLNACRSFRQGEALVERGSVGGIVTVADVTDSLAAEVGADVLALLNAGHPLGSVTGLLRSRSAVGRQYVTIGDPYASLSEASAQVPEVIRADSVDDGFELTVEGVACGGASVSKLGSMAYETDRLVDYACLAPETFGPLVLDRERFVSYLAGADAPVILDGELFVDASRLASQVDRSGAG